MVAFRNKISFLSLAFLQFSVEMAAVPQIEDDEEVETTPEVPVPGKRKRKDHTIEFKLEQIGKLKRGASKAQVSRESGVDRHSLTDWLKKESDFLAIKNKQSRRRVSYFIIL